MGDKTGDVIDGEIMERLTHPFQIRGTETACSLCYAQTPVDSSRSLGDIAELFLQNKSTSSIPIVDNGIPVGIINEWKVLELFSKQYGRALYENKPVSKFMHHDPLIVDETTPLETISKMITADDEVHIRQNFIITHDGRYLGMGSTRNLLKHITEQKIRHASHANPLTLLPGNIPLHERTAAVMADNFEFALVYFDINHFKPFNDVYGYDRGDDVICTLGKLIKNSCIETDTFIAHIGGDDFVAITKSAMAEQFALTCIENFNKDCKRFIDQADLYQGYYMAIDRDGVQKRFSFPTLSAGIVYDRFIRNLPSNDVGAIAAAAKKLAKHMPEAPHLYVYDSVSTAESNTHPDKKKDLAPNE